MTTTNYSPTPITNGDAYAGTINGTNDPTTVYLGIGRDNKNAFQQFCYARYAPTRTSGEIVDEWNLDVALYSITNAFSLNWNIAVGLLVPDGLWDSATGFSTSNYPTWQSMPRPTLDNHTIVSGVMYANAWLGTAFVAGKMDPPGSIYVGEDSTSHSGNVLTITGSAALIDDYFDDYGDSAPLCLVFTSFQDAQVARDRKVIAALTTFPLASLQLTLKSNPPPDVTDPIITSTPFLFAIEEELYSYQIVATDDVTPVEDLVFQQTIIVGFTGSTFSSAGLFEWTPSLGDAGTLNIVQWRVIDEAGNTKTQGANIAVLAKSPPTVVTGTTGLLNVQAEMKPPVEAVVDSNSAVSAGVETRSPIKTLVGGRLVVSVSAELCPATDIEVESD